MRLLTHNSLKNNSSAAKGKGYPLLISRVSKVRVDDTVKSNNSDEDDERIVMFVQNILPTLEWPVLVDAATKLGIPTLPPVLQPSMSEDSAFLLALSHILLHVHLVEGTLRCPVTGREFPVTNEIPNMMLSEDECANVRL